MVDNTRFSLKPSPFKSLVLVAAILSLSSAPARAGSRETIEVMVPEGLEIAVELAEQITSKTHFAGKTVSLVVSQDVLVDHVVVISRNTPATGVIEHSTRSANPGRNGTLSIKADSTLTVDGQVVRLRGSYIVLGSSRRGDTTLLGAIFGPLGLANRGKEARIKPGTQLRAYTDQSSKVVIKEPITCSLFTAPDNLRECVSSL